MQTFYALVSKGASYSFANGIASGFRGRQDFMQTEAENRVQAFLQIYRRLFKYNSVITALKTERQNYMLGFTAEEWDLIAKEGIHIKEGYPDKAGVLIQAISNIPFK
jgi:hypothetical protein